ncbi:MAG TPA: 4a-hydroxytetrahydrobiopterin dehydratase [Blastocatellia bacterium]|nr:4a-hydroxytetrahydrobiopterin dehydratase [Blastocatellia bacterium]
MQKLSEEEITRNLARVAGWSRGENCIEKRYVFKNFLRAVLFVNAVGFVAESINHHPDIIIHYNEVTLRNWTHVANGVTERDFALAEKLDTMERMNAER